MSDLLSKYEALFSDSTVRHAEPLLQGGLDHYAPVDEKLAGMGHNIAAVMLPRSEAGTPVCFDPHVLPDYISVRDVANQKDVVIPLAGLTKERSRQVYEAVKKAGALKGVRDAKDLATYAVRALAADTVNGDTGQMRPTSSKVQTAVAPSAALPSIVVVPKQASKTAAVATPVSYVSAPTPIARAVPAVVTKLPVASVPSSMPVVMPAAAVPAPTPGAIPAASVPVQDFTSASVPQKVMRRLSVQAGEFGTIQSLWDDIIDLPERRTLSLVGTVGEITWSPADLKAEFWVRIDNNPEFLHVSPTGLVVPLGTQEIHTLLVLERREG